MVLAAIADGRLKPGGTVIESTSGNTGTGLAIITAEPGLPFIAIVDHHAAPDKLAVMRALGAELRYVEGQYREDQVAVVERQRLAAKLAEQIPGAIFMNQSDNPANPAGYAALADELVEQTEGQIDIFVSCTGTGGSLSGIACGLKAFNRSIRTIGVEPRGSIIFGHPGHPYYQSGTGTPEGDTVGRVLDYTVIDEGVQVDDAEAFGTARYLARRFGLLVGGSAGGAVYKALERLHTRDVHGTVVCCVADGGEKYLKTIFDDAWLSERRLFDPAIEERLNGWIRRRPQRPHTYDPLHAYEPAGAVA